MSGTPLCDELLKGVAVVIDDEVGKSSSDIAHLIEEIEKRNIPCLKYSELPDNSVIENFSDVPFIILDWKFGSEDGVTVSQYQVEDNIAFIRDVRKYCFVPIFIFTNKGLDDLEEDLRSHNASDFVGDSMIFLKNKSELIDGKLFDEIEEWLKSTPSAYVIKKWAFEYKKAKISMFNDLYSKSKNWPSVFWKGYVTDSTNPSDELSEMLMKNLQGRFSNIKFDEQVINQHISESGNGEDLHKVWEGAYFIPNASLDENTVKPGDVFLINGEYFINIKPECDCVIRNDNELELYLIEGKICSKNNIGNLLKSRNDNGTKRWETNRNNDGGHACFGICGSKDINFKFKSFKIMDWTLIKNCRIGRLTQPFIGIIQQKFASHIQRIGLPPLPYELGEYIHNKYK